jgi:Uma2 family endonuclease
MAMASREDGDFEQIDWRGKILSEAEYRKLEQLSPDRKYEYLYGRVYMMSGGSVAHDLLRRNIESMLARQLRSGPCRVFGTDVQVLLGKKTNGKAHFVYPDITVSCNADDRRLDNTLVESPRVVVEVLSPGTETKDRGIKFQAYQHCQTIQEIVLVNQYFPSVEVWQRNEEHPDNPNAWLYRRSYGPDETVKLAKP